MSLYQIAFYLFAAIAAGGLFITALVAFKVNFPSFIGTAHGLGGLAALGVLFYADLKGEHSTPPLAWWALIVFLGGFIGGMTLFRIIFRNRATVPLALTHGSAGALGLYLLYRAAF